MRSAISTVRSLRLLLVGGLIGLLVGALIAAHALAGNGSTPVLLGPTADGDLGFNGGDDDRGKDRDKNRGKDRDKDRDKNRDDENDAGPGDGSRERAEFRIATLNLKNSMGRAAIAADIRRVIGAAEPSVIGFQERGGDRRAMQAALPENWALRMPRGRAGMDLNPVAFDKRVWKIKKSWPRLLDDRTFRRASGKTAVNQYATVVILEHRETGHVIRAASFHMPPQIHNKRTGGPNFGLRDRVEAFWRMAKSVRKIAEESTDKQQFVAMCDCNVTQTRDTTKLLVRGKLVRPLELETNYGAEPADGRRSIDYVMALRKREFRIVGWKYMENLRTDHPGVIARFRERKEAFAERQKREAQEKEKTAAPRG